MSINTSFLQTFFTLAFQNQPRRATARSSAQTPLRIQSEEDAREPGNRSFFCTLPGELVSEIFGYLNDRDVGAALRVSKDVNISLNSCLEPRIRSSIFNILRSRGMPCRATAPMRILKAEAKVVLDTVRQEAIERIETERTQDVMRLHQEEKTRKQRVRKERIEVCNIVSTVTFSLLNPVPAVINSLSDEIILSGPAYSGIRNHNDF